MGGLGQDPYKEKHKKPKKSKAQEFHTYYERTPYKHQETKYNTKPNQADEGNPDQLTYPHNDSLL